MDPLILILERRTIDSCIRILYIYIYIICICMYIYICMYICVYIYIYHYIPKIEEHLLKSVICWWTDAGNMMSGSASRSHQQLSVSIFRSYPRWPGAWRGYHNVQHQSAHEGRTGDQQHLKSERHPIFSNKYIII